jgi:hypothetical protein
MIWEAILPIGIISVIGMTLVQLVKTISDNRIRRRLIDSGNVGEDARYLFTQDKQLPETISSIKWGFVLVGVGFAVIIGQFFPSYTSDEITAGLIFLMAGAGFLLYYHVSKRILARQGESN